MSQQAFPIPSVIRPAANGISLRAYQEEAIAAIETAFANGTRRPLLQLATGLGKTIVFSELGRRRLDQGSALIIAHRDELIEQAADKYRMIDPGASTGRVKAEKNQMHAEVVFASIQTLCRDNRLEQMPKGFYRTVIVDEAHHAKADGYKKVLDYFDDGETLIVGVTATPESGHGLEGVWHELVYVRDMLWGIEQEYLCDIRGLQVQLKNAEFGRVAVKHGDFQDGASAKMLSEAHAPDYASKAYLEHACPDGDPAHGRKAIVFTPTVALAHEFAAVMQEHGIPAEALDGTTPKEERRQILHRLHTGETRVVCNCAVLTEGFDEPGLECIIVARPTLSRVLYIQMIGRGTRIHPGKADCLVIDLVGATERLNLVTVPNLFGCKPEDLEDGLIAAVAKKKGGGQTETEGVAEGLETVATRVDLFTNRKFNWIRSVVKGHERFVLSTGKGFVVMTEADGLWDVVHEVRGEGQQPLAARLDLGYAQGAAEDFVRKIGAAILSAPSASWRRKPVSKSQREALRKWHVNEATIEGLENAGAASDLLTATIAAKGRRSA